ncbi:MAG: undecaprenyldiphospho-muramoylpentapeptide beta-N-acetylglucosaminyltransferase [Cyanobacteriota bacterium]|nr:undecaprenyldiphospho-muramoylpentapeptide beta-N-acetylglucosaminyltransferase [Cyanobacteriota bacterium]
MADTLKSIDTPKRLLVAASGTGGHLFPALATARELSGYHIEWLGVPHRLETKLVPEDYPLHTIDVDGFQQRLGLGTLRVFARLTGAILTCRQLLQKGQFQGVFTTGGYIAAPITLAARTLGLPVVLHESNAMPGKVTRWLGRWCSTVAVGFDRASEYMSNAKTLCVGTPVRPEFLGDATCDLPVPADAPLIVVVGGSQGAVSVNQLVRECAPAWFEAGAWIVHLTGDNDPDALSLSHPQYLAMPFYHEMAGLLQRADLAISRSGAGTLTELAVTRTPAILIPYPYAADDHQFYNGDIFAQSGAALLYRQDELTRELLNQEVLGLLADRDRLKQMSQKMGAMAVPDSADRLAKLVREWVEGSKGGYLG